MTSQRTPSTRVTVGCLARIAQLNAILSAFVAINIGAAIPMGISSAQAQGNAPLTRASKECRESWMPRSVPSICEWHSSTALPDKRAYAAAVAHLGRIYVAGGYRWDAKSSTVVYSSDVLSGVIDAKGAIPAWTSASRFRHGRSGLGMATTGHCMVIAGGSWQNGGSAVYGDDVQTATILSDGELSEFSESPHKLNVPRSNLSLVVYKGPHATYLYAVAGVAQLGSDTVHLDSVEYAAIDSNCYVGPWSVAHFDLKGGRSTPQATLIGGVLYVTGGWGDLDLVDIYKDVQYSSLRDDGSLSPWETSEDRLPNGIYGHTSSAIPEESSRAVLMLVTGGQPSTGIYSGAIMYSYLTPGQLPQHATGPWAVYYKVLPGERAGHAAAYWKGRLYLIGGARSGGQFLDDVIYSEISGGMP
jgi:hypothetical protein